MTRGHYYNEWDPNAAAWLRNLIAAGHLPPGDVDERSIVDVRGEDLAGYIQCHFFAGVGGWPLALRLAGWPVDRPVWTGSCPCQPYSNAGKRLGARDERNLWPQLRRLVAECSPPTVFGEQVASKDGRVWLAGVRADLETFAYAVGAADLCAAGVGAPHIRQRLWWVGDAQSSGHPGSEYARTPGQEASGRSRLFGIGRSSAASRGLVDTDRAGSLARQPSAAAARHRSSSIPAGRDGGLADANCAGERGRSSEEGTAPPSSEDQAQRPHRQRDGLRPVGSSRLGDALGARPQGLTGHGDDGHQPGRLAAQATGSAAPTGFVGEPWRNAEYIPCADGKARRIEPSIFPLAHGVSGRVGRLRAYGNAIVPQVAAEMIAAYLDATVDPFS